MDSIAYNVKVLVPTTDVWLASQLGPNQYVQVAFHQKPTDRDLRVLLKLIELCRDSVSDAAPQGPAMASPGPVEGPAETAPSDPLPQNGCKDG